MLNSATCEGKGRSRASHIFYLEINKMGKIFIGYLFRNNDN